MTILYRNSDWFLHTHQSKLFIQAKEPLASKIRACMHHAKKELISVYSIYTKHTQQTTFLSKSVIHSGWKQTWKDSDQMTQEWLLFEYLDVCIQNIIVPNSDVVWITDGGACIHSDWSQLNVQYSSKEFIQSLKLVIENLKAQPQYRCKFESAPWSLHSFIKIFSCPKLHSINSIIEHPWWVRQELSTRHSRSPSFSLSPPAFSLGEPALSNSTTSKQQPDNFDSDDDDNPTSIPRMRAITENNITAKCRSFPVIKGSMLSTPPLKSFENHLASKRSQTQPSIMHKIIRISSSFLK